LQIVNRKFQIAQGTTAKESGNYPRRGNQYFVFLSALARHWPRFLGFHHPAFFAAGLAVGGTSAMIGLFQNAMRLGHGFLPLPLIGYSTNLLI
jgi:hypothetical protein